MRFVRLGIIYSYAFDPDVGGALFVPSKFFFFFVRKNISKFN